jgi:hypothetical protein
MVVLASAKSMRVVVESIGQVGGRARAGSHEIVFDRPTTVPGGEDRGPSLLDVMSIDRDEVEPPAIQTPTSSVG